MMATIPAPAILLLDIEAILRNGYTLLVFGAIFVLLVPGTLFALLWKEAHKRKVADRAARRRLDFARLLAEVAASLNASGPESTIEGIKSGLGRVRSHFAVDALSMFCLPPGGTELRGMTASADGVTEGTAPVIDIHKSTWLGERLGAGKPVFIERVDLLPPEAAAEKRTLQQRGVGSIAIVPLTRTGGTVTSFILLAVVGRQRAWPAEIAGQMQIFGDAIHQAHLRQKAESKVSEIEQRFVLAADNAPVMIWMSGTDKLCTYFNQGWLSFTGRTLDQEIGTGWLEGVHPEDAEQCLAAYAAAFDARQRFRLEYRLRRFDGDYRWVIGYGVPRYEPGNVFCGYIGSCIDITELKRSEHELKELSAQLIHAQEDERKRIARELHDDFGQQLTLLGLELAKLNLRSGQDPRVEQLVRDVESRIRTLSRAMSNRAHELHSSHLETLGLASAVSGFCRDFAAQHEINVDFRQTGALPDIPPNVSLCLFRIVQEGLQNIAKHSQTRNCWVELGATSEFVMLQIVDSGVGFDPANLANKTGLGLISMRERLRLVNGEIRLESSPSQGTRLEIWVPLQKTSAVV